MPSNERFEAMLYHFLSKYPVAGKQEKCYTFAAMTAIQPLITTTQNQPLIGIPFQENGKEVIRYFSEEEQADKAVSEDTTKAALRLAGAWSDLDWDEMENALDHIRHDSKPTPPIELDL